jgi:hypothetical protein
MRFQVRRIRGFSNKVHEGTTDAGSIVHFYAIVEWKHLCLARPDNGVERQGKSRPAEHRSGGREATSSLTIFHK